MVTCNKRVVTRFVATVFFHTTETFCFSRVFSAQIMNIGVYSWLSFIVTIPPNAQRRKRRRADVDRRHGRA